MPPLLGCIADDFTGATDLASMLVQEGMRAVQMIGVPPRGAPPPEAEALVVALKSRTAPVTEAIADSVRALDWLRRAGCRQFFFKYCSTFDSTPAGNIGPVADALLHALAAPFALACPALPANGRTVYLGHLFVGGVPLNESGMEAHPLTPMTDANLVRVLGRQTDGAVGLVPFATVEQGAEAIRAACAALAAAGTRYAIVDALTERHLRAIGAAAAGHALVTGGSGIALGLPSNFRAAGLLDEADPAAATRLPAASGHAAVLAGSCSRATLAQLDHARAAGSPAWTLDPLAHADAGAAAAAALDWAAPRLGATPVVIAASAPPARVAEVQAALGREEAGRRIEQALAAIAAGLVARGVRRLVVAGGETAGAVVTRLGVRALRIGAAIDPGVPWTHAETAGAPEAGGGDDDGGLHLALKSGNFGAPDFFTRAFAMPEDAAP